MTPPMLSFEQLARAKARRRLRKPSKAHATGNRKAVLAERRRRQAQAAKAAAGAARHAWLTATRAYWRSAADEHP